MRERRDDRASRVVIWAALATGIVLCLIGVRFLVDPRSAAFFFGIDKQNPGFAPHAAIGLRDLWLGLLLIVFAFLRDWRAIALWLGFATLVCFSDAVIALGSSGRAWAVAFHAISGVFCAVLAWVAWSRAGLQQPGGRPSA